MYSKPCPRADRSIVQMARFYRPFRRSSAHPQCALAPTKEEGLQGLLGLWVLSGRPEGLRAYGQGFEPPIRAITLIIVLEDGSRERRVDAKFKSLPMHPTLDG